MKTVTTVIISLISIFSWSQTITSFPYFTGFEGTIGTLTQNYPAGWSSEEFNTGSFASTWEIIKNSVNETNARTDSSAIHLLSDMSSSNDDWLYTPPIQMTAGNVYTLSFWYNTKQFNSVEKLKVHVGSDTTATAMSIIPLWDNDNITTTTYQEAVVSYTPSANGDFHFGFHAYSDAMQFVLLIDDVTITEDVASSINDYDLNTNKRLVKITDLLGRETKYEKNKMLIYIYSDGSTEKIFDQK